MSESIYPTPNEVEVKQFYAYKLIDSLTGLPFYIGKGTGDRMYNHEQYHTKVYKTATHNNTLLKNKIKKLLRNSGTVRYQKFNCKSEEQAFLIEKALIHKYGRRNIKTGILCNMTDGGEGVSGHVRTEQHKDLLRVAARRRAMKIDQYTMDGKFIRTWDYYKDIINQLHIDGGGLSMCITNKIKSTGGFRWTKSNVPLLKWDPIHKPRKHTGKTVYQFAQDGEFIAKYDSLIGAAKATDKHPSGMLACCKGETPTCGGFVWRHTDDFEGYEHKHTVFQYDENGKSVCDYYNIKEASLCTNSTYAQIQNAIFKRTKGNGFYWSKLKQDSIIVHDKKTSGKPVIQLTKTGEFVAQFVSARQAQNITGIRGVSNCVSGLAATAGGYKWKHVN
ncbi:hypothetical protein M0R04_07330 [Candidatus Dojkabacteria bacterium]|jgi:hypothetical protein|nr:hypothetical protein [Candidatus Dojkabacteria bacterium]